ncbi:MAG: right-handed parallel beta-helix repeat-containing protein, partial [Planctomycetaceae bacterium]
TGNSLGGVSLASSNDQPVLSQNRVVGGSRDAILTQGTDALIVGNEVSQSGSSYAGISASGLRTRIRGNEVYNASYGIDVSGSSASSVTDQIEVTGNLVHHNSILGILASYRALVSGNTAWGQLGSSSIGIRAMYGATAQDNEAFDNTIGIELYDSGTVQGNRVYRNTNTGIRLTRGGSVLANTVYSNSVGIDVIDSQAGTRSLANNLVYANTNQGIRVGVSNTQVINNTVYQPVGNAVLVENSVSNVTLRNNILWVDAGANISVNPNSQVGFSSDYNTLRTSGTGVLGRWENFNFSSLADWRYEVGHDEHSLVSDPDWIDRDGPDNLLGFSATPVAGSTRILDNGDPGFTLTGTWTS